MRKLFAAILIATLTLVSSPVASAQSWSSLGYYEKIASNPYGCDLDNQYLRADNGRCIDKESDALTQQRTETTRQTWRDNPNNCDQATEWIRADNLECKQKTGTTSSTPTQPASQPVVSTNYGVAGNCESYRYLLAQYPGWNVDTMLYAMRGESSCNPYAIGDAYVINGVYAPSCGLLQVRTLAGRPSCAALQDPATNIQTSYQIFLSQGYGAWTVLR